MKIYHAPLPVDVFKLLNNNQVSIFLAGSIEMGIAKNWQAMIIDELGNLEKQRNDGVEFVVLNPRRPAWDSTWVQSIDNPQFVEQVNWELDGIEQCDVVFFHFEPDTMSPITLFELGKALEGDSKVVVSCPPGFWRKGNVDVACKRMSMPVHDSIDSAFEELVTHLYV